MCKAGKVSLDEVFLEVRARVLGDYFIAYVWGKLIESLSQNIQANT